MGITVSKSANPHLCGVIKLSCPNKDIVYKAKKK